MTIVTVVTGVYKPTDNVWGAHIAPLHWPQAVYELFSQVQASIINTPQNLCGKVFLRVFFFIDLPDDRFGVYPLLEQLMTPHIKAIFHLGIKMDTLSAGSFHALHWVVRL